MPRTTMAYPFERKIIQFASEFSNVLTGENRPFLMVFDAAGEARTVQMHPGESTFPALIQRLDEQDSAYLFYDPFDAPEYIWISWRNIARETMERLTRQAFDDSDFVKIAASSLRSPEINPQNTFPETWGVMF